LKATTNVLLSTQALKVRITHDNEELVFSINVFGKDNFSSIDNDVFEYINDYWASLPIETQLSIFKVYKDVQAGFDSIWNKNDLFDYLTDKVKLIYDLHNLDHIQDWISYKSNIVIPKAFNVDYSHSIDNNTSREKTYTRNDYMKLITLSMALRCMIPIWGEYINTTRRDIGNTFKEYYAFQLLNKSNLIHSIPMEKLKTYIEHIVDNDKYNPNNILSSISSEDYGYWLLSLVCVRRLCIGNIKGYDSNAGKSTESTINLITYIYKFIIQKANNTDGNFDAIVKEKKADGGGIDDDNKISILERYKIKTNISHGDVVELEYSLRDIRESAFRLTSNLDLEFLNRSLDTSSSLINERLLDPQIMLLRWVFKPIISPKGLLYLPKNKIVEALGALEAILWARGHKYLAILSTSVAMINDRDIILSPVDSRIRIDKDLAAKLDNVYPYIRLTSGKKTGNKAINLATKSIDILTDNLSMFAWKPTAHESMLMEVFGTTNKRIPILPDIKNNIAKLVIEIGNRNWI